MCQTPKGGRKVASILDDMDVFPDGGELVRVDGGQAAAEHDGLRVSFGGLVEQVSALGRGRVSDAAAIDDDEFRRVRKVHEPQSGAFEKLANLLTFVLIHFAAEC